MGIVVTWLIFWAAVGGLVGYLIGNGKGRGGEGFWLGLLLGFIGWIIVGVMSPSAEVESVRMSALATAIQRGSAPEGPTRDCPHCAETIKRAARVCRFCGRDVEPLAPSDVVDDYDGVRKQYPNSYDTASSLLGLLSQPPQRPAAWLLELCKRIEAGSPSELAAARIPLDWDGPPPPRPSSSPTLLHAGRPDDAGNFPSVAADHPGSYDKARAMLAGLATAPEHPEAWLAELCRRIDAGSPPEAAAALIPLEWAKR
jgi:hypothetical protein